MEFNSCIRRKVLLVVIAIGFSASFFSQVVLAQIQAPAIVSHSIPTLYVYQGDILRVEAEAIGADLRFQWSWVSGEGDSRRYLRICGRSRCNINSKVWPLGEHNVELAVSDENGAAFIDFVVAIVPRPSIEIRPRDITADSMATDQSKVRSVVAHDIRDIVQDGSRFSQSLHLFLHNKDFAARIGFTYATWQEPATSEQSKHFLDRLSERQRLHVDAFGGIELDTNVLRQGSADKEVAEAAGITAKNRQVVHSDINIQARIAKGENHGLTAVLGDERYHLFKPLNIFGLSGQNPMQELNSAGHRLALRYDFRSTAIDEYPRRIARVEPYLRYLFLNEKRIERAQGLQLYYRDRSMVGKPALSLTFERFQDMDPSQPNIMHPRIRQWNIVAPDLTGKFREFDLALTPVDSYNRQIHAFWNISRLEHDLSLAQHFNYQQQAFGVRSWYAANMRHSFAGDLALQSRYYFDDPQARLDRQIRGGLDWIWTATPYLARIYRIEIERSQSSLTEKDYNRIVMTLAGEFKY